MLKTEKIIETNDFKSYLKDIDYLNKLLDRYKKVKLEESSNYIYEMFYFSQKFNQILSKDNLEPLLREKLEEVTNNLNLVLKGLGDNTLSTIYENHSHAKIISDMDKEKYKDSEYKGEVDRVVFENPVQLYFKKNICRFIVVCIFAFVLINSDKIIPIISNSLISMSYNLVGVEQVQVNATRLDNLNKILNSLIKFFSTIVILSQNIFITIDTVYLTCPFMRKSLLKEANDGVDVQNKFISQEAQQAVVESLEGKVQRAYEPDKIHRSMSLIDNVKEYVSVNSLDSSINDKVDSLESDIIKCIKQKKNYYKLYELCAQVELLYESLINGVYHE